MYRPDRNGIATIAAQMRSATPEKARALPDAKGGEVQHQLQAYRTEIYDLFTEPGGTKLLYSAENWVRVKLTLQTAGPVVIGTRATLDPILSGKGRLLDTDVEWEAWLARGTRLYYAAGAVNRISVTIEPVPWLEQVSAEIVQLGSVLVGAARTMVTGAARAVRGEPTTSEGTAATDLPVPTPSRSFLPRLTGVVAPRKMR